MRELERLALLEVIDTLERASGGVSLLYGSKDEAARRKASEKLRERHQRAVDLVKAVIDHDAIY